MAVFAGDIHPDYALISRGLDLFYDTFLHHDADGVHHDEELTDLHQLVADWIEGPPTVLPPGRWVVYDLGFADLIEGYYAASRAWDRIRRGITPFADQDILDAEIDEWMDDLD
jgi:hypothetical protein